MQKFFVETNQIYENQIEITNEDVNHIKNVLRKKEEDIIEICDSKTMTNYECRIKKIENKKILCDIINKKENEEEKIQIDVFQGLPKADKMELIIQKSVELGVSNITPFSAKRSIVKINEKDEKKKIERWQKISEVASKQCRRNNIPKINNIATLIDICNNIEKYDKIIIAYEEENKNTLKNEIEKLKKNKKETLKIGILIGPEGGLDEKEVELLKRQRCSSCNIRKKNFKNRNSSIKCIKHFNV